MTRASARPLLDRAVNERSPERGQYQFAQALIRPVTKGSALVAVGRRREGFGVLEAGGQLAEANGFTRFALRAHDYPAVAAVRIHGSSETRDPNE